MTRQSGDIARALEYTPPDPHREIAADSALHGYMGGTFDASPVFELTYD
jgi:hypothetical protein